MSESPEEILQNIHSKFLEKFNNVLPRMKGYFITGGVFPRLYHNIEVRDIDLFAENTNAFNQLTQEITNNSSFEYDEENSHPNLAKFIHESGYQLDIVNNPSNKRRTPSDFIKQFDFTVARVFSAYDGIGMALMTYVPSDLIDIAEKKLTFTGNLLFGTRRNNTLTRMLKYTKLGFKIKEEHYVAIGEKIHDLIQKGIDEGIIDPTLIGGNRYY